MSHSPSRRRRAPEKHRGLRVALVVTCAILLLILAAIAWVGTRALLAKAELENAVPLATSVQSQLASGNSGAARDDAARLADHANAAASLTSDPVWLVFEGIPSLGANLSVVRQLADAVKIIANEAVLPLTDAAEGITIDDFKPVDGAIDLQPLVDARSRVAQASAALSRAEGVMAEVDASDVIPQVQEAAEDLTVLLSGASESVGAVDRAVRLVPEILGVSGPRDYLVLFQNPAELRASGGIAGAVAQMHTEGGQMQLVKQVSSAEYTHYDSPVLDLPVETRGIYGDITGQYIQDVNLTPDFVQSAELAQEMWRLQFGVTVDGVLSIDPVALSYLLRATGPITLPTGDVLSPDNTVQLLLADVYERYPDTDDQDAFFAAAAASVFSAIAGGDADPIALIAALSQSGAEHRVLVWSADAEEQSVLADTTLAGGLPISDTETQRFGIYLNDATGAKMGPYLGVQTAVGQITCREDQRPNYAVEVTLTNSAPGDAATVLPKYVTGGGAYGVAAGNIKTLVSVYGAPGMENLGVLRDGADFGYHPAVDAGYPVSGVSIVLSPGETTTIRLSWLGSASFTGNIETQTTPVIHRNETNKLDLGC